MTRHHRRRGAGRHRLAAADRAAVRPGRQRRAETRPRCTGSTRRPERRPPSARPGRSPSSGRRRDPVDLPARRRLRVRLQPDGGPHPRRHQHRPELPDQPEHRRAGRRQPGPGHQDRTAINGCPRARPASAPRPTRTASASRWRRRDDAVHPRPDQQHAVHPEPAERRHADDGADRHPRRRRRSTSSPSTASTSRGRSR